ncbi:hypothetical protein RM572_17195 [Streptomyces sp. DSM 42041]|uniref:Integral membrane protein n=1 Tax=Streptomyces hazeniae TaxID=3075538 RepID=A0ABU2NU20_9ACTN|nr:hypothetical protein [Streptomyces sp. DSM 42041]MDT0380491.1 hypothetical protein [Streptomyces sp. DSM 42041]
MSYPPDPNNPYGAAPSGDYYGQKQQPAPGYGYPQQQPAPGYGYPQQQPYPAAPGMPGGGPQQGMPAQAVTARVLLFVAGSLWALMGLLMLIGSLAAQSMLEEMDVADSGEAVGVGLLLFLLFGGLAALHIVPASMFGKGGTGARVTGIIASSLNSLVALLALLGGASDGNAAGVVISILWTATAVVTVIFLAMGPTGAWFNRPRY